jgi:hypothetical protein
VTGKSQNGFPGYAKFILGADNQFTEDLYALVEFHFNGAGSRDVSTYALGDLQQGLILNLGRQFITVQGVYLVHPLVTLSAGTMHSITDGSGFLTGSLAYSATEYFSVTAGGQVFQGNAFVEFWYYPSSAYLRLDCFF